MTTDKTAEKATRGGSRPGAGRKDPITKTRMNFMIDNELVEKLQSETNKSALVNTLLKKHYTKATR